MHWRVNTGEHSFCHLHFLPPVILIIAQHLPTYSLIIAQHLPTMYAVCSGYDMVWLETIVLPGHIQRMCFSLKSTNEGKR